MRIATVFISGCFEIRTSQQVNEVVVNLSMFLANMYVKTVGMLIPQLPRPFVRFILYFKREFDCMLVFNVYFVGSFQWFAVLTQFEFGLALSSTYRPHALRLFRKRNIVFAFLKRKGMYS